jgi:hypothetical protein
MLRTAFPTRHPLLAGRYSAKNLPLNDRQCVEGCQEGKSVAVHKHMTLLKLSTKTVFQSRCSCLCGRGGRRKGGQSTKDLVL